MMQPSDERVRINAITERLKETLKSEDVQKIRAEMEELTRAFHEISTRTYQQAGAQYQQREGPKEGGQGAADAEYKVVDEED
jgi:molecular chaperone DnaK